ncbi:MAG: P-loop NTPase fold protein [Bacteroidota bacterium]
MQRLDEIVDLYLNMDTNYALMITGDWGVGKTYYFKHTLKDKISATPVFHNTSKKYRPILVSLFGLKSIEEIQSEIFLCLYPILKNTKFKLGTTIGKAVAKGILHLKGLGEYSKYVEEIDVNQSSLINFEELVLCFDDLERISKNLNIEEFIGYVNTLVENENVKILIIANEGKISDQNYNALKEKVVGNSIEFIPSIGDSYNSILADKFTGFQLYKEFLETNKDFILETFTKKSANLRTLIFALNYFQRIYSEVNNQLFSENNLKEKQAEVLLNLLKFTITISIEYKEGRITFKKRNELDASSEIDWSTFLSNTNSWQGNTNTEKEKVKTEREIFIEDYYTNDKFNFYNSVYDYLTGGTVFKYSLLIDELKKIYHIEENIIQAQYEIYDKLGYHSCFSLNNEEYLKVTKMMLDYAYNGSYDITHYTTIFHFATRFNNPLRFNLNKLEKAIIKGMKKGKKNYKYNHSLDFHLGISSNTEHIDHINRIRKAALDLNNEILSDTKTEESSELEKLCYDNFEEFYKKVLGDLQQPFYVEPILSKFDADKFYSFFFNSEPSRRWAIVKFFFKRYREYPASELKPDIAFLQKLKERVERKSDQLSGKNITAFVYSELVNYLQLAIERLNSTTH